MRVLPPGGCRAPGWQSEGILTLGGGISHLEKFSLSCLSRNEKGRGLVVGAWFLLRLGPLRQDEGPVVVNEGWL